MRKWIAVALASVIGLATTGALPAAAQSSQQYYLVDLVNQLRAEYGLPPYAIDPALMAAAQAHSEWAASVGSHSHTGAGGSTPTDRAIAAGYGGGQQVRVSENIFWGTGATPQDAIGWWRNSDIHFQGMTSTNYVHIGAGVAYGDNMGYFTLNFGLILGGELPQAPPPAPTQAAGAAGPAPDPIELAEPNEDGSVVHVVGEGQTLWAIAAAYDVPLSEVLALNRLTEDSIIRPGDLIVIVPAPFKATPEPVGPVIHVVEQGQTLFGIALTYGVDLETLLALNGLTEDSIIRPGDRILIRPAEATPMPEPTLTPTLRPTAIAEVFFTATPEARSSISGPPRRAERLTFTGRQVLIGVVVVIGVVGVGLMVAGLVIRPGETAQAVAEDAEHGEEPGETEEHEHEE